MAVFRVYTDSAGNFHWRFQANNGRIMADSGEGYNSRQACLGGMQVLKDNDGSYQTYVDRSGEYRWRFRARNGRMVADSSEGYYSSSGCQEAIDMVRREAPGADIEG
jgi:uncharacterized protein YegP (UPF0339 family)